MSSIQSSSQSRSSSGVVYHLGYALSRLRINRCQLSPEMRPMAMTPARCSLSFGWPISSERNWWCLWLRFPFSFLGLRLRSSSKTFGAMRSYTMSFIHFPTTPGCLEAPVQVQPFMRYIISKKSSLNVLTHLAASSRMNLFKNCCRASTARPFSVLYPVASSTKAMILTLARERIKISALAADASCEGNFITPAALACKYRSHTEGRINALKPSCGVPLVSIYGILLISPISSSSINGWRFAASINVGILITLEFPLCGRPKARNTADCLMTRVPLSRTATSNSAFPIVRVPSNNALCSSSLTIKELTSTPRNLETLSMVFFDALPSNALESPISDIPIPCANSFWLIPLSDRTSLILFFIIFIFTTANIINIIQPTK